MITPNANARRKAALNRTQAGANDRQRGDAVPNEIADEIIAAYGARDPDAARRGVALALARLILLHESAGGRRLFLADLHAMHVRALIYPKNESEI